MPINSDVEIQEDLTSRPYFAGRLENKRVKGFSAYLALTSLRRLLGP